MNKTQYNIIKRLLGYEGTGGAKVAWSLTLPESYRHFKPAMLSLQRLNEIDQAGKIADKYPEVFAFKLGQWRQAFLTLLNQQFAQKLLNDFGVKYE